MSDEKRIDEIVAGLLPAIYRNRSIGKGTEYYFDREEQVRGSAAAISFEVNRMSAVDDAYRATANIKKRAVAHRTIYHMRRDARGRVQVHAMVTVAVVDGEVIVGPIVHARNANAMLLREVRRAALAHATAHSNGMDYWVASAPDAAAWGDLDVIAQHGCNMKVHIVAKAKAIMDGWTGGVLLHWARSDSDAMVPINPPAAKKTPGKLAQLGSKIRSIFSKSTVTVSKNTYKFGVTLGKSGGDGKSSDDDKPVGAEDGEVEADAVSIDKAGGLEDPELP